MVVPFPVQLPQIVTRALTRRSLCGSNSRPAPCHRSGAGAERFSFAHAARKITSRTRVARSLALARHSVILGLLSNLQRTGRIPDSQLRDQQAQRRRLGTSLAEADSGNSLAPPFSSSSSVQSRLPCPGIASRTAATTASTEIPFMHRKSMGHSRRKQGEQGTLALMNR